MGRVKQLNICQVNARSLLASGRLTDLEILCSSNDIDVLCITETWLSSDRVKEGAHLINIPGFLAPFRCDRAHRRGGGVAVYVREGLNAAPVRLEGQLEAVCIELYLSKQKRIVLLTVYRPPNGSSTLPDFISDLDSTLINLRSFSRHLTCVVGDFNAKSCNWWSGQTSNDAGIALFNLMLDHGLTELVEGPTRLTAGSSSQLDLMFTNDVSAVDNCKTLPPVSDHCATLLQLNLSYSSRTKCHSTWDYNNADFSGLNNFLSTVDWSPVFASSDVNEALSFWENLVLSSLEAFVPRKHKLPQPAKKPWYSSYLLRLRRQRDRLFHRSKTLDKTHRLSIAFRKVRNLYVAELRSAERAYYRKQSLYLSSNSLLRDSHRWWRAAKSACGIQTTATIPPLVFNGKTCLTSKEKAECLNLSFAEQCSAPPSDPGIRLINTAPADVDFSFHRISTFSVYKRLSSLNIWRASGLDGISNRVLKECAGVLSEPLSRIFNYSISSGTFPSQWKRGAITPLYKHKGNRSDPKFYRPVALLPCVSKVFEGFIREQLQSHCLRNKAIPDEQFGFLPKRSTLWQLLSVIDDWERTLDDGHCVHACLLDMAKAFDRVDHQLLLQKLRSVGAHSRELDWFQSYLSGRSICTQIDGIRSSSRSISSGVPQGSVLGPLLFIIFYRDLPSVVSCTTAMFADDTLLYDRCSGVRGSEPCCHLSEDLTSLNTWATDWCTSFNASKSAHLIIRRRRKQRENESPTLSLNAQSPIPLVSSTRHLGVQLSDRLSWAEHVAAVIQRTSFKVYTIKRLAQRVGATEVAKRLYIGLVRPALEYASPVWDDCTRHDAAILERLQLAVARAILHCARHTRHNVDVLQLIDWPTLAWRRRRTKLLIFWELLHGNGPPQLVAHVPTTASSRSSHSFRNKFSLAFPFCRTSHRLNSFLPASISLFNSLPSTVSSCSSRPAFLRALDAHFAADRFSFGLP